MTPYPLWSLRFWRAFWLTARPYLFFVSGASGLLGISLANADAAPSALAFGALFFSYGLGQALTDVFQVDTDALSSPYRPLVKGEITRSQVLGVSLLGLAVCGGVIGWLCPWTLAPSALAVAGLATYTFFKRRWWGGPPYNSWIVALLPLIGLVGAARSLDAARRPGVAWAMASTFFSYGIFVLIGYLKDVQADGKTGYRTLPVVFGRRRAVVCSAALFLVPTLCCSVMLLARAGAHPAPIASILWIAGATLLATSHLLAWRVQTDDEAHPAVAWSVRGFVTLHLAEAALVRPSLLPIGVAMLALFEVALASRPEKTQI